jgi:hypothetical protein
MNWTKNSQKKYNWPANTQRNIWYHWTSRKCESKRHLDFMLPQTDWLSSGTQVSTNIGKDVGEKKHLNTGGT